MFSLIPLAFAAVCKAIMDTLMFHYGESVFKTANPYFWNPLFSWMNKYKDHDPKLGEAFFLSKSVFVGFTDAWHMFGMFNAFFLIAAIVIYSPITKIKQKWLSLIVDFTILKVTHQVIFHVLFTYAFMVKK